MVCHPSNAAAGRHRSAIFFKAVGSIPKDFNGARVDTPEAY